MIVCSFCVHNATVPVMIDDVNNNNDNNNNNNNNVATAFVASAEAPGAKQPAKEIRKQALKID